MRQLALDFADQPPRYGRADFLVSDANAAALAMVDAFVSSAEPALAITGPPASGKTHLAHILADGAGAAVLTGPQAPAVPAGRLAVIDGVEAMADPAALLLLVEACRERGLKLALAGRGEPRDWARGLKDLETRLAALPRAGLNEPDEALLRAVLAKGFADRRLRVPAAVTDYAAPRMARTFAAARGFLLLCEREMRESASNITVPMARKVLENLSEAVSAS